MKTITEYQPLIYAALFSQPQQRRTRQRRNQRRFAFALLATYFLASIQIMSQTGFAAWNWQFWVMFLPLFGLGEQLLSALTRKRPSA